MRCGVAVLAQAALMRRRLGEERQDEADVNDGRGSSGGSTTKKKKRAAKVDCKLAP